MPQSPHYKKCSGCKFQKLGLVIWGEEATWCNNPDSKFWDMLTPDSNTCKDWKKK